MSQNPKIARRAHYDARTPNAQISIDALPKALPPGIPELNINLGAHHAEAVEEADNMRNITDGPRCALPRVTQRSTPRAATPNGQAVTHFGRAALEMRPLSSIDPRRVEWRGGDGIPN